MHDIKSRTTNLGLNPDNSIVIGSGILNALKLRKSNDIDVVVSDSEYQRLADDKKFKKAENHGHEILQDGLFEIGTCWEVLGREQLFEDLIKHSIVMDDVRYVSIEFLLSVKRSWLKQNGARQKDVDDIKLIEEFLVNSI